MKLFLEVRIEVYNTTWVPLDHFQMHTEAKSEAKAIKAAKKIIKTKIEQLAFPKGLRRRVIAGLAKRTWSFRLDNRFSIKNDFREGASKKEDFFQIHFQ